jgi:hypothetical protein
MSDIILKFWPKEEVNVLKTDLIKNGLANSNIIGDETEFWNKPAFKAGSEINLFFEPRLNREIGYFDDLAITVSENDYGVLEGEEDFDYIDRMNVVSILGGDGNFEKWDDLTNKLKEITGDEYQGGYELL